MDLQERQDQVIEEFDMFGDWMSKYEYIIELGKDLPLIDEALKVDDNLIKGCQSKVWLDAQEAEGTIIFKADSDAIITKGIVALVIRVLSGLPVADIANADLYFVDRIGLKEHLSPTRSNGLLAMIKQMKFYALAYQSKANG